MAQGKTDNLEAFAKRIASRVKSAGANTDSMERLICRLLTGDDAKVAGHLAGKWVEWRYGKSPQPLTGGKDGENPIRVLVEHIGPQNKAPAKAD